MTVLWQPIYQLHVLPAPQKGVASRSVALLAILGTELKNILSLKACTMYVTELNNLNMPKAYNLNMPKALIILFYLKPLN